MVMLHSPASSSPSSSENRTQSYWNTSASSDRLRMALSVAGRLVVTYERPSPSKTDDRDLKHQNIPDRYLRQEYISVPGMS